MVLHDTRARCLTARSLPWTRMFVCILLISSTAFAQAPTPAPEIDENAVVTAVPTAERPKPTLYTPSPRPEPTDEEEETEWVTGVSNDIVIAVIVVASLCVVGFCVKIIVRALSPHERNLRKVKEGGVVVVLKPIEKLPRLSASAVQAVDLPLRERSVNSALREEDSESESELSKMEHELNVDLRRGSRSRRNSHSHSRRNSHSHSRRNSHSHSRRNSHAHSRRNSHQHSRRNSVQHSRRNSHQHSRRNSHSNHPSRAAPAASLFIDANYTRSHSHPHSHSRDHPPPRDAVVIDVREGGAHRRRHSHHGHGEGRAADPLSTSRRPHLGDNLRRWNSHQNLSPHGTRGMRSHSDEGPHAGHHTEPMGRFNEERFPRRVHTNGSDHLSRPSGHRGHRRTRSMGDRPVKVAARSRSPSRRHSHIVKPLRVSNDLPLYEARTTRDRKRSVSRSRTAELSHEAYDEERKIDEKGRIHLPKDNHGGALTDSPPLGPRPLSPSEQRLESGRGNMMNFVPMVTLSPEAPPKYSAPTCDDEGGDTKGAGALDSGQGTGALDLEAGLGGGDQWQTIKSS